MTDARELIDAFYARYVPLEVRRAEKFDLSQSEKDKMAANLRALRNELGASLLSIEASPPAYGEVRRYPAPYGSAQIELRWEVRGLVPKRHKAGAASWLKSLGVSWKGDSSTILEHVESALAQKDPTLPAHRFELVKPTVTVDYPASPELFSIADEFQRLKEFQARTVNHQHR